MPETKYAESDYIMISALQHIAVCPRQCALIHNERMWEDNLLTAQGELLHIRVDNGGTEKRGDLIQARTVRLNHPGLGITGIADMVEFRRAEDPVDPETGENIAAALPNKRGWWIPCPVEYKRGRSKTDDWDRVQLCAQVLCLESMYELRMDRAALWYDSTKTREWVHIDNPLREKTMNLVYQARMLLDSGKTPAPVYDRKRCNACSLYEQCRPRDYSPERAEKYYKSLFQIIDP